ncbi:MAG: signal recognition particle-docking protein FtsY [Planctomycetota bacterium]|nr:MAG: signal recognition particle-docking protein FtsY [Planctomycetota bacterium]
MAWRDLMVFGRIGRFFERIKTGLAKTRSLVGDALRSLIGRGRTIDKAFLEELEDTLIAADIGVAKTEAILDEVQAKWKAGEVAPGEELLDLLKRSLREELDGPQPDALNWQADGPTIILIIGVNGAGKTTSIAKLAKRFKDLGKSVLVAAGDTYRAAATQQLTIWAERVGVDIVKQHEGADAAAVAFDAVAAAKARGTEVVIIDTAGRLHNRDDLMRELDKIHRVIKRHDEASPHETFLVVDGTAGQNAIQQARIFSQSLHVSGLILTKLDGTAKGGSTIAIRRELGIPVRYIGVGEGMDDFQPFDADTFVAAIFGDEEA